MRIHSNRFMICEHLEWFYPLDCLTCSLLVILSIKRDDGDEQDQVSLVLANILSVRIAGSSKTTLSRNVTRLHEGPGEGEKDQEGEQVKELRDERKCMARKRKKKDADAGAVCVTRRSIVSVMMVQVKVSDSCLISEGSLLLTPVRSSVSRYLL